MSYPIRSSILLLTLATAALGQDASPIGWIKQLKGSATLHPSSTSAVGKEVFLHPNTSIMRALFDGDVLTCALNSAVIVSISGHERTLTKGPTTLHADATPSLSAKQADEALAHLGRPGASRSVGGLVWSPANDASVRLANFRVLWNRPAQPETFTLSLAVRDGAALWSTSVASADGGLTPKQELDLRQLLQTHRQPDAPGLFTLTLASEMHGTQQTNFTLLSLGDEARVTAELQAWDNTADPILRAVGQADVFERHNLLCEAADAYDAALRLAPESEALLKAGLAAAQAVGDLHRSREFKARLESTLASDQPSGQTQSRR